MKATSEDLKVFFVITRIVSSPGRSPDPPSHNVFFVITRIVSRPGRLPNPPSRNVLFAITRVISRPGRLPDPPSHNVFFVITRIVSRPGRSLANSQCILCDYSRRLETRSTTRPTKSQCIHRNHPIVSDPADHQPSHNVFSITISLFGDPAYGDGISSKQPLVGFRAIAHKRRGSVTYSLTLD